MLKPTANYKMTKQSKRYLAGIVDPIKRSEFKHMCIQSELAAAIQPKREKTRRDPKENS
jgi:hypothetical protein